MANFATIHGPHFKPWHLCQPGDHWNIALIEPLHARGVTQDPRSSFNVVEYTLTPEGQWVPSSDAYAQAVVNWCQRHQHTPNEAFDV
jgi:hypothetical protein